MKKQKNHKKENVPVLGLDFGKVIMGAIEGGVSDTSFLGSTLEQAMESPATSGAVEAVRTLVDIFDHRVWIVSKCGPSVQKKTASWLDYHDFYGQTGMPKGNVRFCLKRPQKAPICRQLAITHFVDDRADVLEPMVGIVPNLYLFGEQRQGFNCPGFATEVGDWPAVVEAVTDTIAVQSQ